LIIETTKVQNISENRLPFYKKLLTTQYTLDRITSQDWVRGRPVRIA